MPSTTRHITRRLSRPQLRRALLTALLSATILAPPSAALAADPVAALKSGDKNLATSTSDSSRLAVGNGGTTAGPVVPSEGPNGLELCREDEEAQESICIPWAQEGEDKQTSPTRLKG